MIQFLQVFFFSKSMLFYFLKNTLSLAIYSSETSKNMQNWQCRKNVCAVNYFPLSLYFISTSWVSPSPGSDMILKDYLYAIENKKLLKKLIPIRKRIEWKYSTVVRLQINTNILCL